MDLTCDIAVCLIIIAAVSVDDIDVAISILADGKLRNCKHTVEMRNEMGVFRCYDIHETKIVLKYKRIPTVKYTKLKKHILQMK